MHRFSPAGGVVIALACGSLAIAGEPGLDMQLSINGGEVYQVSPQGKDMGDGTYTYEGAHFDPATGLVVFYSFTGRATPEAGMAGQVSLYNWHPTTAEIEVEANFFPGQAATEDSVLKGFGLVGLTAGDNGGVVTSSPPWLMQTLIDGEPVGIPASMFFHPFQMTISGPGQASAFDDFGIITPSIGDPVQESIGMRLLFTISDSDSVAVSAQAAVVNCPGDLDGDGNVSTIDLTIMLDEWGPCGNNCAADLDGDGNVGTADLLTLLEDWGPCPGLNF